MLEQVINGLEVTNWLMTNLSSHLRILSGPGAENISPNKELQIRMWINCNQIYPSQNEWRNNPFPNQHITEHSNMRCYNSTGSRDRNVSVERERERERIRKHEDVTRIAKAESKFGAGTLSKVQFFSRRLNKIVPTIHNLKRLHYLKWQLHLNIITKRFRRVCHT